MERPREEHSIRSASPVMRETSQVVHGTVPAQNKSESDTDQEEALIVPSKMNVLMIRTSGGTNCTLRLHNRTRELARSIGEIDWVMDSTNTTVAQQAFTITEVDDPSWESKELRGFYCSQLWLLRNMNALCGNIWIIDARQLLMARKLGIIQRLPTLLLDELDDRNKGDLLVKVIAMWQILWLFIQVMTRLAKGTPITQLEVMATAFSACSLLTYYFLLDRPQDVQTSCTVAAVRHPIPLEMLRMANAGPRTWGGPQKYPWIPNNAIHWDGGASLNTAIFTRGAICCMVIFGGIHCLAWNSEFPTYYEAIVWRFATILTIAIVPTAALLSAASEYIHEKRSKGDIIQARHDSDNLMMFLNHYIFGPVFAVARILIVVEAFRTLAFQPPTVFVTTWAANAPHVG